MKSPIPLLISKKVGKKEKTNVVEVLDELEESVESVEQFDIESE